MGPNYAPIFPAEVGPICGSPAFSMMSAPFWLPTGEKPLENADVVADWRCLIIESAGEPHLLADLQPFGGTKDNATDPGVGL